ncbi:hypothetical protein HMPREF1870_01107 [Bacteroidales bacterium KA00344]|nr:hypothetical protein HMPREF1870_01107 [Bacteroidales bacterium KA00344]
MTLTAADTSKPKGRYIRAEKQAYHSILRATLHENQHPSDYGRMLIFNFNTLRMLPCDGAFS